MYIAKINTDITIFTDEGYLALENPNEQYDTIVYFDSLPEKPGKGYKLDIVDNIVTWVKKESLLSIEEKLEKMQSQIDYLNKKIDLNYFIDISTVKNYYQKKWWTLSQLFEFFDENTLIEYGIIEKSTILNENELVEYIKDD